MVSNSSSDMFGHTGRMRSAIVFRIASRFLLGLSSSMPINTPHTKKGAVGPAPLFRSAELSAFYPSGNWLSCPWSMETRIHATMREKPSGLTDRCCPDVHPERPGPMNLDHGRNSRSAVVRHSSGGENEISGPEPLQQALVRFVADREQKAAL
jgi:hypothetical protein